ncbi:glycosyltransferase [Tessaracoccus massiliensis]|uniref:glycosyltransferase n=1 Tax=Tessaracoccus massiliensis TaxID=1522311 RepID=UPI00058D70CA|nr:glycosyltransferase [Tessaracoccus massiliensis]
MSLRVAILIDDFFPASGGIGRSVQTQLEELSAMGHDVTLIAPDRHLQRPAGVRTIACPTIYKEGLPAHLSVLYPTERRAKLISRIAEFDVVHSQTERGALVLASRLARLQGIPHVHTFHANIAGTHSTLPFQAAFGSLGYELLVTRALGMASKRQPRFSSTFPPKTSEPDNNNFFSRMDWRSLGWIAAHVDAVTSPAQYMLDNIEAAVAQPILGRVIPNASMDTLVAGAAERRHPRAAIRFLSIGRLAKEKRLDVVVRAFNRAAIPGAELIIVGDGDQRTRLEALAGPEVSFLGALRDRDAVAEQFREADALVLGSYRFDVQPMVILEAGAAQLPVLYCDDRLTAGLSAETSHLVAPNMQALAKGMQELAEPRRLDALRAGYGRVDVRLRPADMARAYVEVYEEAIRMPRRHG